MPKTHELLKLCGRGRVCEGENVMDRTVVGAESKHQWIAEGGRLGQKRGRLDLSVEASQDKNLGQGSLARLSSVVDRLSARHKQGVCVQRGEGL